MFLTVFAQLRYVDVLHWVVRLYYYGFLVNEGVGLILLIQTFDPSSLIVIVHKSHYAIMAPTVRASWITLHTARLA